ncbi:ATP-binding protein [Desulfosarcina cetonica]|uniref:ATP-binding protein n=1 Tax=Desulfosarcina cetonica TaxID=90730 RepID=UPI0006D1FF75|nr:ATP-binding protein [Desulfosarcina cetonica]
MEVIGRLRLTAPAESTAEITRLERLARFTARWIVQIMDLTYRNRMTAGLHGQVVNESYIALKEKADQLALSEARYRRLATDLEIEVEKKTREIRNTQLVLFQQEKMAAIGQLAAGMAHEINNPIGFIISNLNTLKGSTAELVLLITRYRKLADLLIGQTGTAAASQIKTQLTAITQLIREMDLDFVIEDTQSLIEESLDGAKRVNIIVENLRDFAHPSIERTESVNFNTCLDTTLAMLSSHVQPGVNVHREYGDIPEITCHLREINYVFFNILKNAIQAVGHQGSVTLRTAEDGNHVVVAVTDTGVGIAEDDQANIFDPFFTTREVGDGTGLGLFHAYNSVKSLGGTIGVESAPDRGSTFTIRIPVTDGVSATAEPIPGSAPATLGK